MGFFSWLASRWSDNSPDQRRSLLYRNQYDDPALEDVRERAAEDVAAVEQDDKYFGADRDDGL
jgi:hypothetical protein